MAFDERKPTAVTGNVGVNMDAARDNFVYLREVLAFNGELPGYDIGSGDLTYNADGTLATAIFKEQTAIATANGRGSGTRYWFWLVLTYESGALTKVRFRFSANSGTSYNNWVDAAGNSYLNLTYTGAGLLDSALWGTS